MVTHFGSLFGSGWRISNTFCGVFARRCFVHWSGEAVGPVARGKLNGLKTEMQALLKPHHLNYEASSKAEMEMKAVVDWIVSVIVSDDMDASVDVFSVDGFMAALAEEKKLAGVIGATLTATRPKFA